MNAGEIIATLKLRMNDFQRGIERAQGEVDKFNKRWETVARDFRAVGAGMAAIGTGIAVGIGGAVKTAADFESQMSRVGALSGATGKDLQRLTKEARRLGATTVFSASQAAEGMQYLAMAGYDTNQIIAAMPGVLNMAAAGQVNLGDAANIATNIMSGFNLKASEAGRVADVLTKAFTSSNTTLHGLGETMKYAAPAAAAIGWSLEEVTAAAARLGDVGIDASMAGTALRAAMVRLANPTGKAKKLLEQFNIQITDSNGKVRPLHDILAQMKDRFSELSEAERAAAIQTIFGTEAMSAMMALMEDPKALKNFTEELKNAGGTAQEIAEMQMDNLHGALEELGGAFEEVQISIGTALIPLIRSLAVGLTNLVNWFNSLPDGVKNAIAYFLAFSSVLLVVGGGALLLIGFLPNIIQGFKSLGTVMKGVKLAASGVGKAFIWLFTNPVGLTLLAIGALTAGIIYLINNFDSVKAKLEELGISFNSIRSIIELVQLKIGELLARFMNSTAFQIIASLIETLKLKILDFGGAIKHVIETGDFTPLLQRVQGLIPNILMILIGGIPRLIFVGMNLLQSVASGMGLSVPELLNRVIQIVVSMVEQFITMLPFFVETGVQLLLSVVDGILSMLPTIVDVVVQLITTFLDIIVKNLPKIIEVGVKILLSLVDGLIATLPVLLGAALTLIIELALALIRNLPKIIETGVKILLALIEGIFRVLPSLLAAALTLIIRLAGTLIQNLPRIIAAGGKILLALIQGITKLIPRLLRLGWEIVKSLASTIIQKIPDMVKAGKDLVKGLWNGIKNAKQWILDKISGWVGDVTSWFKRKFGIASPSIIFRDEIGAMLMRGLEIGIEMTSKNPLEAMMNVAENIVNGANSIIDAFTSLGNIEIQTPQLSTLSTLNIESGLVGSDGGTVYNAPLVNVENMHVRDENDIRGLSRELFNLQRSHDRAKGGR